MLSTSLLLLAPFHSVAGLNVVGFAYTVDAFHLLLSHLYIDSSSPIFESVSASFWSLRLFVSLYFWRAAFDNVHDVTSVLVFCKLLLMLALLLLLK
jgi:hypothetical protein